MQSEVVTKLEPDTDSPKSQTPQLREETAPNGRLQLAAKASASPNGATGVQFPPPKTDKPRPHVCGTCTRSFARLEHLKRHERSHTKEKPFECPECTRCFARRDLLLRHQQKLHMTTTAASKPRAGRRESTSGASVLSANKVRKNSVANANVGGSGGVGAANARPRANTISHLDLSSLGLLDGSNPNVGRVNELGINAGLGLSLGLAAPMSFDYRGIAASLGHHGNLNGLPKLHTHSMSNFDVTDSLKTAPPLGAWAAQTGFDLDQLFSPGTTVNPAQLHFGHSASATVPSYHQFDAFTAHHAMVPEGDDFAWMREWNMQYQSCQNNELAIDESSPSRLSSGDSPGEYSESIHNSGTGLVLPTGLPWQPEHSNTRSSVSGPSFQLDALGSGLPNLDIAAANGSPSAALDRGHAAVAYFHQTTLPQSVQQQHQNHGSHEMMQSHAAGFFAPSLSNVSSDSPSLSSSSLTGSARQGSVTSASTDSITDATRQALLSTLAQPSVFGHSHRKYSQPSVSSPLSPGAVRPSVQGLTLPSTGDIRRYVDAFIQYAHPHLPVTHIPTLSFDSAEFCSTLRGSAAPTIAQNGIAGGGGCLILGMAAIGALYEYDHPASKELFEAAKKMIQLYLEERRKVDMSAAVNGSSNGIDSGAYHPPLWLVQAMLLNVIYGHQCGDKMAADIASNHCAALVSLARAADLARPPPPEMLPGVPGDHHDMQDVDMHDANSIHAVSQHPQVDLQTQWLQWKVVEERKRTLFAIFIVSSLLTTAYNQTPTIMNSEILLDLPCSEELWSAESAQAWHNHGGLAAAEHGAVSFADALSTLLTANQRQGGRRSSNAYNGNSAMGAQEACDASAEHSLKPSTFGCLVLIDALHNYIWETRSRHHGRQWTPQETESMFSHIEPALNAWQAAWKANEHHKLERPNPFGFGPLSADSIPLLDLAFVRLFVNLGRSKEAFWQRDFDAMADELARGDEIVQHAEPSPLGNEEAPTVEKKAANGKKRRASQAQPSDQSSSKRERHLRKAAFYAADSLTIACSYNLTYADVTAHELPVQSAMCFFDCSQVLAEWACTVQERVGRYLGVLGRDNIDYTQVPAIMLLETEDVELLRKIERICESLEAKRFQQDNLLAMDLQHMSTALPMNVMHHNVNLSACGYGSKILRVTAMMLEKAVVWPVTHVMAKALETQAFHMDQRAQTSTLQ